MPKSKAPEAPRSLVAAIRYFSDEELAFNFVRELRWPDGQPFCPRCGEVDPYFLSSRKVYKCRGCHRQFSLKVGTIFEDSPLGWDKWLPAVWLIANSKNSVSSHELARSLGVTQKSAWFMLHRIRLAMETGTFQRMTGTVEADETYIGGKAANMHKRILKVRGLPSKVAVQGVRERETGTVKAAPLDGKSLTANIYEWVAPESTVYTDEAGGYRTLRDHYNHGTVTHTGPMAVRYVVGDVHTNGIENFWALLKRAIKGTQVRVDPKHVQRYVTERAFAYNNRTTDDLGRMYKAMRGAPDRRLTYKALTASTVPAE